MAIEVMRRYENKYMANSYTYMRLQNRISQVADMDEYCKLHGFYTISNLYCDTDDDDLIRASIAKPQYKEKLRLRAYGVPVDNDMVFLEIKKKYNDVTNKRRTAFALQEAYGFIATGSAEPKEYMNKQVLMELEYFINLHKPMPKLYLAYERRAYIGDGGLRITFDTNIRTRRHDLALENGDHGEKLLDDDLWVCEVKAIGGIPVWLTRLLSEYKLYRQGFSKYGMEYQKHIAMERGGVCSSQLSTHPAKRRQSHGKALLSRLA